MTLSAGEGGGFSANELPFFVLLGVIAGLLSAIGTDCIIGVSKYRKASLVTPRHKWVHW